MKFYYINLIYQLVIYNFYNFTEMVTKYTDYKHNEVVPFKDTGTGLENMKEYVYLFTCFVKKLELFLGHSVYTLQFLYLAVARNCVGLSVLCIRNGVNGYEIFISLTLRSITEDGSQSPRKPHSSLLLPHLRLLPEGPSCRGGMASSCGLLVLLQRECTF